MSHEQDLTVVTDAAWAAFRRRLADHVASMVDDDVLVVEHGDAVGSEDETAPYVQLCAHNVEWVRVEAAGNAYLDDPVALDDEQESLLAALGWCAPADDGGFDNFHIDAERRDADRVAVLLVCTLREVYRVLHPAFLDAAGLEVDPDTVWLVPDPPADVPADGVPIDADHLQVLVDDAMREVFPDLKHDAEGDIPIIVGQSVAFVRVLADRPGVEVYAEVALDVVDVDRLPLELGLLNQAHPLWKFVAVDDFVVMRHELVAMPFSGHLLRGLVRRFVDEVDAIAADLVARVGGRRFRDPPCDPDQAQAPDDDLAMTGLLELCHLGRPRAATAAGMFDHDRSEIIRQIVRIRTGRQHCDGHDVDDVLTVLRKALRLVSDGEPRPEPLPPKPRSAQASLLADADTGEDTLDIGWPA